MAEETINKDYQKGFNEGYLITKHLPGLSDNIAAIKNDTPRLEGFRDGRQEYSIEKAKAFIPAFMKPQEKSITPPEPNKEKDKGLDVDR